MVYAHKQSEKRDCGNQSDPLPEFPLALDVVLVRDTCGCEGPLHHHRSCCQELRKYSRSHRPCGYARWIEGDDRELTRAAERICARRDARWIEGHTLVQYEVSFAIMCRCG